MKSAQIKYGGSEVVQINQSAPEPIVYPGKVLGSRKGSRNDSRNDSKMTRRCR